MKLVRYIILLLTILLVGGNDLIHFHFAQDEPISVSCDLEVDNKVESETEEKLDEFFNSAPPAAVRLFSVNGLEYGQMFYFMPSLSDLDIPPEV